MSRMRTRSSHQNRSLVNPDDTNDIIDQSNDNLPSQENISHESLNQSVDIEEQLNFQRITNSFRNYEYYWTQDLNQKINFINHMKIEYQDKLTSYKSHLGQIQQCIKTNAEILNLMVREVSGIFENQVYEDESNVTNGESNVTNNESNVISLPNGDGIHMLAIESGTSVKKLKFKPGARPSSSDMDKTQSILRQLAREWTLEGEEERKSAFEPLIQSLEQEFGHCDKSKVRVLVPGCGLGRLPYEIASRGFSCQGNEYSLFMLFISNYILNNIKNVNSHSFHPWIHNSCNNYRNDVQTKKVLFPDANPASIPTGLDFSMAAGNFISLYGKDQDKKDHNQDNQNRDQDRELNNFDAVVTCFFIDTAPNIVAYVDTIYNVLKPGGIWINLGPLLYHFASSETQSIEPSYQVLRSIIESFGFFFKKEETRVKCQYTQCKQSMLQYNYDCVFFVVEKPA